MHSTAAFSQSGLFSESVRRLNISATLLECRICTVEDQKPQKSRWKFNYLLSAQRMSSSPYLLGHWPSGSLTFNYVYYSLMCSHKLFSFPIWHRSSAVATLSQDFSRAPRGTLMGLEMKTSTVFKEKYSDKLPSPYSGWVGEKKWSTNTWGLYDSEILSSASDFGRLYSSECIRI